jgi:hypothetical protein
MSDKLLQHAATKQTGSAEGERIACHPVFHFSIIVSIACL